MENKLSIHNGSTPSRIAASLPMAVCEYGVVDAGNIGITNASMRVIPGTQQVLLMNKGYSCLKGKSGSLSEPLFASNWQVRLHDLGEEV